MQELSNVSGRNVVSTASTGRVIMRLLLVLSDRVHGEYREILDEIVDDFVGEIMRDNG